MAKSKRSTTVKQYSPDYADNIDESQLWLYYLIYLSMAIHVSVMTYGMNW